MTSEEKEFIEAVARFRTLKINDLKCPTLTKAEVTYLLVINYMPKPVTSVQLAKYFGCSKVYVSKTLSKLEDEEYIGKKRSKFDKRAYYLELLPKASNIVKKYTRDYNEKVLYLAEKLGEEKAAQLCALLNEASDAVDEYMKNEK